MLDHYSAAAIEAHLQAVGDLMLDAVPAELVGSVFCDSLEVYGSDWTATLPAEFARGGVTTCWTSYTGLTSTKSRLRGFRADYHRTLDGALRGELRRRVSALGGPTRRAVPDSGLRNSAGHDQ